jgi:hypothetical protein
MLLGWLNGSPEQRFQGPTGTSAGGADLSGDLEIADLKGRRPPD